MKTTLGRVRKLLREELQQDPWEVAVYGPFRRGRGDYTIAVCYDWKDQEHERLVKLPNTVALEPAEEETADRHDNKFAVKLDADNDREARSQAEVLVNKLEGKGFEVDYCPTHR